MSISKYQKYKGSYQAYHLAHREEILERQRKWREKNPDYQQQYRKNHPDYFKEYRRKARKRHSEYYREYKRKNREMYNKSNSEWRKRNPEKVRAEKLVQKFSLLDACEFCGATGNLEHGHIDYDYPEMFLTVCRACNVWMDKPLEQKKP